MVSCAIIACNYFRIWAGLLLSISGCDVTSKMSAAEKLLLLSAAASASTISLVAFSCKRKKESMLNDYGCVLCSNGNTSRPTTVLRHMIAPNAVIGCNLPHEYFPTCLKVIACRNCSALYAIIAHETTAQADFLWSPYVIGQTIIFLPCDFFLLSSSFFSSPNLSGRRLDVYHTSTHGVALVRI